MVVHALDACLTKANVPRGEMRSRSVDAHVEIEWFSYDSNKRARAEHLQHFVLKHRWVSKAFMLNCLQYYCVWYGFDMFARAWTL